MMNKTNQQQQQNMYAIMQLKQEIAQKLFEEKLNSEIFPEERIPAFWRKVVPFTYWNIKPFELRASLEDYISVLKNLPDIMEGKPVTLYQFGMLTNSIELKSALEIINNTCIGDHEYIDFVGEVTEATKFYNTRIAAIREEANKKADKEASLKATAMHGQFKGGLSALKAEA
jgi:hypothetical protein